MREASSGRAATGRTSARSWRLERAGFCLAEWQRRYLEAVMGYGEPGHLGVPEVVCEDGEDAPEDVPGRHARAHANGLPCPVCRAEV